MRITSMIVPLCLISACAGESNTPDVVDPDVVTSELRPTKRSEVLAAPHHASQQIMIFGGNDGPVVNQRPQAQFRKDTWLFVPGTGWSQLETDNQPSRRGRYALGTDTLQDRTLLFGGRFRRSGTTGDYEVLNDLWAFDWLSLSWTQLDEGTGPSGRYYPAGAWDSEARRFYVWGGATNTSSTIINPSSELWSWSDDEGWVAHETTGEPPSSRTFIGDTYDPTRNRILVFGGQVGDFSSFAFNDLYALDLDDFTWTQLHDGQGDAPSTRMHAALQYDEARDRYLLFGGHTDYGDANDLWSFDPEAGAWSVVYAGDEIVGDRFGCIGNDSEVPSDYVDQDLSAPERRHRGMHTLMGDNLWIAGGMHSECSDHLDDTWRYELATDTWIEVIEAQSGESCARRGDACQCLCL